MLTLSASYVAAQSQLPINLQKIIEYNTANAQDFAVKISFFIAFIAGLLGILSPCILPFLPAYFSYTFKEKKNITKMTLVFFLGFSAVFIIMGVIAGYIGEQSLAVMQQAWIVTIAGIFMIILGVITIRGKKVCNYLNLNNRFSRYFNKSNGDFQGTFLFGVSFALGWTACLGPILAGILGIGAILNNMWYSGLLLFFYSLGNLVPLFVLSIFYDKLNLSQNKFIIGRIFTFKLFGKNIQIHSTNLISGILFIILGMIIIIYKGTSIINKLDIFGTKSYFYSLQSAFIEWKYANLIGIAVFIFFILIIGYFLRKELASE
ncbi:sulfite exporter TauE/SafE family protein [Candidatus Woesearchaeota archaeon]|nr:sulfite exporter TauE/SafE family protein [Candidatus Woesearchaeota archaeon]